MTYEDAILLIQTRMVGSPGHRVIDRAMAQALGVVIERGLGRLIRLKELVAHQAEDGGLWFEAETAPEAYLQQELRRLHALVEEPL